jgi:hypothetical protein
MMRRDANCSGIPGQQRLDAKAAAPDADVSAHEAEIDAIVERLYFGSTA